MEVPSALRQALAAPQAVHAGRSLHQLLPAGPQGSESLGRMITAQSFEGVGGFPVPLLRGLPGRCGLCGVPELVTPGLAVHIHGQKKLSKIQHQGVIIWVNPCTGSEEIFGGHLNNKMRRKWGANNA